MTDPTPEPRWEDDVPWCCAGCQEWDTCSDEENVCLPAVRALRRDACWLRGEKERARREMGKLEAELERLRAEQRVYAVESDYDDGRETPEEE